MDQERDFKIIHHAYFISHHEGVIEWVKNFIKKTLGVSQSQNPDFFHEFYETLTIDESRRLKELHLAKAFTPGEKRIFIIETLSLTHEAQNALLKILEEPNQDSHFFLIAPSFHLLLPTLRSRLFFIEHNLSHQSVASDQVEKFLKLSKKDKVDFVHVLAKEISEEKKSKYEAQKFLSSLEQALYEAGVEKNQKALRAILTARDYLNDRSASVKQLLEYVALSF